MLELKNIIKVYGTDDNKVNALKGISIDFREHELVSILGPSGCGKTTLLNIVGGLDKYTDGDLIINDKSTKDFTDRDWDTYRNQRVGFVFQSYNLIPHLTVLGNVEMSLTLSGIPKVERRAKAIKALEVVGLSDQIKKKPNQLSGGQMQRVAIARAIVNNPDIILADEPTGALDSVTSIQVMNILKDLAKERLVIMVTHNNQLAEDYSTRIIELLDGEIIRDTKPYRHRKSNGEITEKTDIIKEAVVDDIVNDDNIEYSDNNVKDIVKNIDKKHQTKKSAMSFFTAFNLSLKNLFTKKTRTMLTSFAGSIGIIGVALVLAVSNGFTKYINKMQSDTLSGYPITINTISADLESIMNGQSNGEGNKEYPDDPVLHVKDTTASMANMTKFSFISPEYIKYLKDYETKDKSKSSDKQTLNEMVFSYSSPLKVIGKQKNSYINICDDNISTSAMGTSTSSQFMEGLSNKEFVESQYDVIYGRYPSNYDELALVVSSKNELSKSMMDQLAIEYTLNEDGSIEDINFSDLISTDTKLGKTYKLLYNDEYYKPEYSDGNIIGFSNNDSKLGELYEDSSVGLTLKITGVFRVREDASLSVYSNGLVYTPMLTDHFRENAKTSQIVQAQKTNMEINPTDNFYFPYKLEVSGVKFTANSPTELKQLVRAYFNVSLTDDQVYQYNIQQYGASEIPNSIYIYPKDFESKDKIIEYLTAWNDDPNNANNIVAFSDATAILSSTLGELVNVISYVLIAFASISLVVSSIMIGIITYVSVVERTKEIGVLRALGARKKDIRRVFNAETLIIGFSAGLIGVLISGLLTIPISLIVRNLTTGMVANIAILNIGHAITLVVISMALTLISGLVPAQIASKKDPVVALRTE